MSAARLGELALEAGLPHGVLNVIVTMTGRSSGRLREVPLYAFEDGARLVVIGSNAGGECICSASSDSAG